MLCFVSVLAVFYLWHKKIRQAVFERKKYADAEIIWNDKKTDIRIFVDSGCMLEKSPCGRSIIIVSLYEIKSLFPKDYIMETAECKTEEEIMLLAKEYDISEEFEVILFSTAAGAGTLASLKCQAVIKTDRRAVLSDVSAGIFMGSLFADNDCGGIIGAEELKNIMGGD